MMIRFRPHVAPHPTGSTSAHRRRRLMLEALEDRSLLSSFYVSTSGSDLNSGASPDRAIKTIQKAVDLAQPGDVVNLSAGEYRQDIITRRNGTQASPITITGPSNAVIRGGGEGHVVEVNNNYITFQGFTVDGLFGDPNSASGYRDKLLFAQGKGIRSGVTGMRVLNMTFRNSGGEAVRLRYFAQNNEIAFSNFIDIGVYDFRFNGGGKNGEAVYIGTSSEQWNDGKNPTNDPDGSNNNWVHGNSFNTRGNEGVDIKEGSMYNVIEFNTVTGQKDVESGGINSRGDANIIRDNEIFGNLGAGVRLGGHTVNGVQYGKLNDVYRNNIHDNQSGGIKFQVSPQGLVGGNTMARNATGNSVGSYGSSYDPTRPIGDVPPVPLAIAAVIASGDDGNVAANTIDNKLSTRWSAKGAGQWIQYDLGALARIEAVKIAFYKGSERSTRFAVETSADGVTWTPRIQALSSGTTTALESFAMPAGTTARYVRIYGYGNTRDDWNSLTQVVIEGSIIP